MASICHGRLRAIGMPDLAPAGRRVTEDVEYGGGISCAIGDHVACMRKKVCNAEGTMLHAPAGAITRQRWLSYASGDSHAPAGTVSHGWGRAALLRGGRLGSVGRLWGVRLWIM